MEANSLYVMYEKGAKTLWLVVPLCVEYLVVREREFALGVGS